VAKFDFPAAILAGGRSRRMGQNKSFLSIDGSPAILRVANTLREVFSEAFVVANDVEVYEKVGFRVTTDILKDNDSLGGLHAAVSDTGNSRVFVTGCDMPFLQPALLIGLASLAVDWDVVIPIYREFPEPLCAIYSPVCEGPIRRRIESGRLKMIGFHDEVRVRKVEEAEWRVWDSLGLSFRNINTPNEFAEISESL